MFGVSQLRLMRSLYGGAAEALRATHLLIQFLSANYFTNNTSSLPPSSIAANKCKGPARGRNKFPRQLLAKKYLQTLRKHQTLMHKCADSTLITLKELLSLCNVENVVTVEGVCSLTHIS
ncbi:hypothetical protein VTL71DRAFT_8235 [Oculimacula yallundae]|uniref:Uncharacterized protein n=1 Tax=Oculimacula yallundae TaxID=86028 RepID=A0ABR4CX87_9HELO